MLLKLGFNDYCRSVAPVWIRVGGVLAALFGFYYIGAAHGDYTKKGSFTFLGAAPKPEWDSGFMPSISFCEEDLPIHCRGCKMYSFEFHWQDPFWRPAEPFFFKTYPHLLALQVLTPSTELLCMVDCSWSLHSAPWWSWRSLSGNCSFLRALTSLAQQACRRRY